MAKKLLNTPKGAYTVFSIYYDAMKRFGFDLRGKTILNIGAGDLVGLDALFLLFGAKRIISLDLRSGNYRYPELSHQVSHYAALWNLLIEKGGTDNPKPWDGIIHKTEKGIFYNTHRLIRITPADASRLPIKDGCIDFTFSNAVLEHVADPEKTIHEIARTLSPGGHTMHRVDLRDHADFSKPYEFLKPGRPSGGCNLWRAYQFETAFQSVLPKMMEFNVFDRGTLSSEEQRSLQPQFAGLSRSELEKLRFMIYAQKH